MPQAANKKAFTELLQVVLLLAIVVASAGCSKPSQQLSHSVTFQLTSNSMSPRLLGPHFQATCAACGHSWKIAAETLDNRRHQVACSRCQQPCTLGPLQPGQQVTASWLQPSQCPQRLDCVVFTATTESAKLANQWVCKRVWGLPGESIELRQGELIVDGRLFQKTLQQMRQVAIPVAPYSDYRSDLFSMRQSAAEADLSLGLLDSGSARFGSARSGSARSGSADGTSWLTWDTGHALNWSQPIVDDYPENQSTPRNLVAVHDLLLEIEFDIDFFQPTESPNSSGAQPSEAGPNHRETQASPRRLDLALEYQDTRIELQCLFVPATSVASTELSTSRSAGIYQLINPRRIWCGGWDGQLFCESEGETEVRIVKPATADSSDSQQPLAAKPTQFGLSILQGPVRINKLAVFRDLYLRANERDTSNGTAAPLQLGADEFFVLGDNLPISIDSRNGLDNLSRQQIWGVVP